MRTESFSESPQKLDLKTFERNFGKKLFPVKKENIPLEAVSYFESSKTEFVNPGKEMEESKTLNYYAVQHGNGDVSYVEVFEKHTHDVVDKFAGKSTIFFIYDTGYAGFNGTQTTVAITMESDMAGNSLQEIIPKPYTHYIQTDENFKKSYPNEKLAIRKMLLANALCVMYFGVPLHISDVQTDDGKRLLAYLKRNNYIAHSSDHLDSFSFEMK